MSDPRSPDLDVPPPAAPAGGLAPRVTLLSVTPIKGFGISRTDSVDVGTRGADGDRDFFVLDAQDGLISITQTGAFAGLHASWNRATRELTLTDAEGTFLNGTAVRGKAIRGHSPYGKVLPGYVVEGPWTEALSSLVGQPVRLVEAEEPGFGSDVHPVTLLGDASVAELERQSGVADVDRRRFRMLIGFDGAPAHAEDGWRGRHVRIGGAEIRIEGPVPRCAAIARDPESGRRDLPLVREIKVYRGLLESHLGSTVNFGVYAAVVAHGRISVGDVLEFV